jgi:NADH:ubiquinone oxidoreductase subunit 2 (subunit N)
VYVIAAQYRGYEPSEAAGLKYYLLGALSSAIVFMGLGLIYTTTGSTNLK